MRHPARESAEKTEAGVRGFEELGRPAKVADKPNLGAEGIWVIWARGFGHRRSETMTNAGAVDQALQGAELPEYVLEKRFQMGVDTTGDRAVWIWVVLSDDKEDVPSEEVAQIRNSVRGALKGAGIDMWTYLRFRTESEQATLDNGKA